MKQHECRDKNNILYTNFAFKTIMSCTCPLRSFWSYFWSYVLFFALLLFFSSKSSRRFPVCILDLLQLLTCLSNTACLKLICPEITRCEVFLLTQNISSQFDLCHHYYCKGLDLASSSCFLQLLTLTSGFWNCCP